EHRADQRGAQRRDHADSDRHLRTLDRLGKHIMPPAIAAPWERSRALALGVLQLGGALLPLGILRRQRIDIAQVGLDALLAPGALRDLRLEIRPLAEERRIG